MYYYFNIHQYIIHFTVYCLLFDEQANLINWCKSSYSELFVSWVHIKAVRVFVESVLRFGLPVNFTAAFIKVHIYWLTFQQVDPGLLGGPNTCGSYCWCSVVIVKSE